MNENITSTTTKQGISGASYMFLGSTLATAISAIATILIARFLGPKNYGIYYLIILFALLLSGLRDLGINIAVTYYISRGSIEEIKKYAGSAVLFDLIVGLTVWSLLIVFAPFFGETFKVPGILTLFLVGYGVFIGMGLLYISSGILIGIEKSNIASFLLLLCSILRNALSLAFIFVLDPVFGALLGQSLGYFAVGIIGSAYALKNTGTSFSSLAAKELILYGVPYAIYQLSLQASFQVIGIIACPILGKILFGAFSTAIYTFSAFVGIASLTGQGLLPAFARSTSDGYAYSITVKFLSVIFVPISALIVGLAGPIVLVVWGEEYAQAIPFFCILFAIFALTTFGLITSDSFLLGNNKPNLIALIWIPSIFIGVISSILLYELVGPISFGLGIAIAYLIATFTELFVIRFKFHAWIDVQFSLRMLLVFIILATLSNLTLKLLNQPPFVNIITQLSNTLCTMIGMSNSKLEIIVSAGIQLVLALIVAVILFTLLMIFLAKREDLTLFRTATHYLPFGSILRKHVDMVLKIRKKLKIDKK